MKKYIAVAIASALLFGCGAGENKPNPYDKSIATEGSRAYTRLITEIDGCRIYYVYIESSSNLYMARCGDAATLRWQSGKTSTDMITVEEKETLERAEQIKKRQAILSKLSQEEKDALGIVQPQTQGKQ